MADKDKYDHLENALNDNLLQFYDTEDDGLDTSITDDLASIDKRYSNFELLAEGGTKRVYKALDNVVQRDIAYARLQEGKEKQRENFLREARLTSLLQHPGIISVLDMGLEEEDPFFTMELKVGHSLGFILKKLAKNDAQYLEKYNLNKLLDIYSKICEAVSYAHSQEIIHLDLKPDNIQVGEFGEVVICDWGLGKLISDKDETISESYETLLKTQTMTGAIKGTPGFMAPEQIKKGDKKDCRTDIYALGSILYNILTLKIPFDGEVDDILKQTVTGDFIDPIIVNNQVSESLNAVCLKAMETKQMDRYQNIEDLQKEIENYLSGFATKAENASFIKHFSLFFKRHKALMVTVTSGILIYFISSLAFINKISDEKNEAIKQKQLAVKAQNDAEKSFQREKVARQEAEEALEMYEEQRSVTQDYRKKILSNAGTFMRHKMYLPEINRQSYIDHARNLRLLAEKEGDDPEILKVKGSLAFAMHNFREAEEQLQRSGELGLLVKILKDFHTKVEPKNIYSVDEVVQLIKLIYKHRKDKGFTSITRLLRFESMLLRPKLEKAVEATLQVFNGNDIQFNLNNSEGYLELGSVNTALTIHHNRYNFLRMLKVRHLKIKGSVNYKKNYLNQLRILVLDISEAKFEGYDFLKSIYSIKKLIYKEGQLTEDLKDYLKQYFELVATN